MRLNEIYNRTSLLLESCDFMNIQWKVRYQRRNNITCIYIYIQINVKRKEDKPCRMWISQLTNCLIYVALLRTHANINMHLQTHYGRLTVLCLCTCMCVSSAVNLKVNDKKKSKGKKRVPKLSRKKNNFFQLSFVWLFNLVRIKFHFSKEKCKLVSF